MVGSPTMSIHGWRQLVEWSIQYSCLSEIDQVEARRILKKTWEEFCQWIVNEYGDYAEALDVKM
jgi:adenosine deaminase CECR1